MKSVWMELRVLRIPVCAAVFFVAASLFFAHMRIPLASFVSSVLVRTGETPVFTKADRAKGKPAPKEKLSKKAAGSRVRRKTGQIQSVPADRAPLYVLDSAAGKVMADSCFRSWLLTSPQTADAPEGKPRQYTFTALNGDLEPGRGMPGIRNREPAEFHFELQIRPDRAFSGAKLLLSFNGEIAVLVDGKEVWHSTAGRNESFNRKKPFTVTLDLPEKETRIQLKSRGPDGKRRRLNVRMTDRDDAPLYFTLQAESDTRSGGPASAL